MSCPELTADAGAIAITFDDGWDADPAVPVWWTWSEMAGWWDTPIRAESIDLAGTDGELYVTKRTGRPLVVTAFAGIARPDDYWAALARLRDLSEAFQSAGGTLTLGAPVNESYDVVLAPGQLGEARVGTLTDEGLDPASEVIAGFRFQMSFMAADPAPS